MMVLMMNSLDDDVHNVVREVLDVVVRVVDYDDVFDEDVDDEL